MARDDSAHHRLVLRYWLALHRRDVAAAGRIVDECLAAWPPRRLYTRLFEPALALSGDKWFRREITYHDEHFVTHHTLRFLRRARRALLAGVASPSESAPLALATGVSQQSHLIGLSMVCDFLRRDGWRVRFLEHNYRSHLIRQVEECRPAAVLMSIGLTTGLPHARRLISFLRAGGYAGLVVVGGAAINNEPARVAQIGADLTARNGVELIRRLHSVLAASSLEPSC